MQVPRVSFSNEAGDRGFDQALRASDAEHDAPRRDLATQRDVTKPRSEEHEAGVSEEPVTEADLERSERTVGVETETARVPAEQGELSEAAARRVGAPDQEPARPAERGSQRNAEEGETARRNEAGKGAASPASIAVEDRLRAQVRTTPAAGLLSVGTASATGAANLASPRNTGTPLLERAGAAPRTERPAATTPGFRTFNKQTLELAEQARDSVFKQIAMRLSPEQGEVRMLLDPPDLGQLDVRMAIDDAGRLTLSMITERPELAVMLDKHMPELARSLAQGGLTIAQAAVQQQSPGDQRRERHHFADAHGAERSEGGSDHDSTPRIQELARRGFFTAEGFDFWV